MMSILTDWFSGVRKDISIQNGANRSGQGFDLVYLLLAMRANSSPTLDRCSISIQSNH